MAWPTLSVLLVSNSTRSLQTGQVGSIAIANDLRRPYPIEKRMTLPHNAAVFAYRLSPSERKLSSPIDLSVQACYPLPSASSARWESDIGALTYIQISVH